MPQSAKKLYGLKLGATDGEIGEVKDFYFDDRKWVVRYLVADTGGWLSKRRVLLAPHCLGKIDADGKILDVSLDKKHIEDSPPLESHTPVSRRYEMEYYQYHGWPYYWQGDALWGNNDFPVLAPMAKPGFREGKAMTIHQDSHADSHLRSTKAVGGYHLRATDEIIGHVCDFMVDTRSWSIHSLMIKIGHRFSGEEIQMPVSAVDRISYEESTVFAKLSKAAIERGLAREIIPTIAGV